MEDGIVGRLSKKVFDDEDDDDEDDNARVRDGRIQG